MIVLSAKDELARVAVLEAGRLLEYTMWPFNKPGDLGDVFSGRVTAKVPSLAGSFVDLGFTSGFLPDNASDIDFTEGAYLTVEISRIAQAGKGPRLIAREKRYDRKVRLIRQSLGPVIDFATRYPDAPIAVDDHHLLATICRRCSDGDMALLPSRLIYKNMIFDNALEDELALLSEPTVKLPGGGSIHVTLTPALTAIDIDSGASSKGSFKPGAQLIFNVSVLPELARQILLRNLSGAIFVDFAGMKSSSRLKLLTPLNRALLVDPLNARCLGFSHLGLAEISRRRVRPPLNEFLK